MGVMKDFDIRIRSGGDDAIAAVNELLGMLKSELVELERALPRWIAVAEQLPSGVQEVLVYWRAVDDDGRPACAGIDGRGGLIGTAWYERLPDGEGDHWVCEMGPVHPTHWMRLPSTPGADE
jgi:hypothetical protein